MSLELMKGSLLPRAVNVGDADDIFIIQAGVTKIARKNLIGSGSVVVSDLPEIVSKDVITVSSSLEYYPRPGAMLQKMVIISGGGEVKIGTTLGGSEVLSDTVSGSYPVFERIGAFVNNELPIYFSGNFIAILFWAYPYGDNNYPYKAINVTSQFSLSADLIFIPAGFVLDSIVLIADTGDIKIGTAPGGGEIIDAESDSNPFVFNFIGRHFPEGANLYFTGLFSAHFFLWDLHSTLKKVSSVLKNEGDIISIPQNSVIDICYILPESSGEVKIGTTPGGSEIFSDSFDGSTSIVTNSISAYFAEARTLYLTNISTLKIGTWNVF